ncbi:39S ribosomal protein L38, mitochondrial [Entomortierella chlamydospora]|uniref:Large ribosomal subunit protein uL14m n=1 Tax=Entomortierella chlamydospora TaxID=101097 RepID=A0A9P6MRD1_9FUNG|nr:39S ribosomal protein L38, mitochondrial [Mortierella sp. AM989]KAF9164591.1 39S ribosomal protein L38, mitochondrial [Mortierella sp. AD010]KAF9344092.1 39S ribosomal protein L38, mitochondrial [Mortierella sp. AD094]KAF9402479.1 39S ribosomal protein L38, mitochondrial [Mortierella sp. AD011]KAF9993565.1 39S ribosomal protein L38, mitochondrial [Entomortierella chlamydospora]
MLQLKSILNVIDNSGAVWAECIRVLHGGKYARIGDEIVVVVNKAKSNAVATASGIPKVKKGDVRHALVVRARKETLRPDGRYVRFDDNACVLLNKQGEPLGTRVLGVVSGELRQKRWMKLLSLAPKVV